MATWPGAAHLARRTLASSHHFAARPSAPRGLRPRRTLCTRGLASWAAEPAQFSDAVAEAAEVLEFAGRQPRPIPLKDVLEMKSPEQVARIVQEELPVRLANRIAHLDTLPHLQRIGEVDGVRANFLQSFAEIRRASPEGLALAVERLKARHADQAWRMTSGLREWKEQRTALGDPASKSRAFVDGFLDRFFLSWVGVDAITSQYLELVAGNPHGVVDQDCDPCEVARMAAAQVMRVARMEMVAPPKVIVSFHGIESARTLPLIPTYLFYIVTELLKNSVRAVGELHEARGGQGEPPPVELRVSSDASQVALQIGDLGGGIPFEHQSHVWSYMYTTAKPSRSGTTEASLDEEWEPSALAGYGVGLPLSRIYAEYIGGSLHLMSMPNFGTHAYLFLSRMGHREEALPTYVNWLRKHRLRVRLVDLETKKREAVDEENYFEAGRLKAMAVEVKAELTVLDREGLHMNSMDLARVS